MWRANGIWRSLIVMSAAVAAACSSGGGGGGASSCADAGVCPTGTQCVNDQCLPVGTGGAGGLGGFGAVGGSAGAGASGGVGGAPDPVEPGSQPPPDPGVAPGSAGAPTVLAVRTLLLGETDWNGNPSLNAWQGYGYNLDGIISTKAGTNHCTPQPGANPAKVKTDGPDGQDNSFGQNLIPILKIFASNPSDVLSASIADGGSTLLLRIDNLSSAQDQSGLFASLFVGAPRSQPPLWDGSDVWPIDAGYLVDPGNSDQSKVTMPASYVAGSTFVSAPYTDLDVALNFAGYSFVLPITRAVITTQLAGTGSQAQGELGIIAGVLPTETLINSFSQVAGGLDPALCEGQTFESVAAQIRAASDIMVNGTNGDPSQTCDAISIGIGFRAQAALIGSPAIPGPPNDPCPL
jgi:hypothetical protein